jgi:hypothetical protein
MLPVWRCRCRWQSPAVNPFDLRPAQLAELLTHLGEPPEALPEVTPFPRRRRTALRLGALATAAAAALAVTFGALD